MSQPPVTIDSLCVDFQRAEMHARVRTPTRERSLRYRWFNPVKYLHPLALPPAAAVAESLYHAAYEDPAPPLSPFGR
jgi:hypothetical protein